jgi:hypothetical protein
MKKKKILMPPHLMYDGQNEHLFSDFSLVCSLLRLFRLEQMFFGVLIIKFVYTSCTCLIFIHVHVSVKLCKSILCHVKQFKCKVILKM